jgi:hypothetical protein
VGKLNAKGAEEGEENPVSLRVDKPNKPSDEFHWTRRIKFLFLPFEIINNHVHLLLGNFFRISSEKPTHEVLVHSSFNKQGKEFLHHVILLMFVTEV